MQKHAAKQLLKLADLFLANNVIPNSTLNALIQNPVHQKQLKAKVLMNYVPSVIKKTKNVEDVLKSLVQTTDI